MKLINSLFLMLALSIAGCSHGMMRGSVAMKTSDDEAHVCLGDKEVKVGDRVIAFNNVCSGGGGPRSGRDKICEKRSVGGGSVIELLNQHYSVVKFDQGVKFAEGTVVEKN